MHKNLINSYDAEKFPRLRTHALVLVLLAAFVANEVQVWTRWLPDDLRFIVCQAALMSVLAAASYGFYLDHRRLRQRGYLDMASRIDRLVFVAFVIVAETTGLYAVVYVVYPADPSSFFMPRWLCLALLTTLQTLALLVVFALYLALGSRHNAMQPLPDVHSQQGLTSSLFTTQRAPFNSYTSLPAHGGIETNSDHRVHEQEAYIRSLKARLAVLEQEQLRTSSPVHSLSAGSEGEPEEGEIDRDRLVQELERVTADFSEFASSAALDKHRHVDQAKLIKEQQREIRQLQKEAQQLSILVQVHKDANSNAQKVIEALGRDMVLEGANPSVNPSTRVRSHTSFT